MVNVIAKKGLSPFFRKGDKVSIIPVLYENDVILHDDIYGLFKNGKLIQILTKAQHKPQDGFEILLVYPKLIAKKGTYKDSYIRLKDGREYPSSLVRSYEEFFEKI